MHRSLIFINNNGHNTILKMYCSSIVTPVLDHYVLVSGGSVRVSDVTGGGMMSREK